MIDLDDLRAFKQVATLLSFSGAAQVLGIRKSAVSRSVQRLEAALQLRLLERTTRTVALTDAGRAMLDDIDDIASRLEQLVDRAADLTAHPRGRLRVTAGIGFGLEVLTELLPEFSHAYPDIAISLDLTSRVVDLVAEQIDVAFRMGPLADSNLVAIRLGAIGCSLAAAPAYLDRRGLPLSIDELGGHDIIAMPRADGLPRQWSLRHDDGTERLVDATSRLTANDPHAICRMVLRGAGISAIADFVAFPEIEHGRLVPILPAWRVPAVDVSIVMPSGRTRNPAVRAFVDFVRERSATRADWFG